MSKLRKIFNALLTESFFKRLVSYWILIIFLYLIKDFFWLFFLTFIFSYIFLSFWVFIKKKIHIFINKFFSWTKSNFFRKLISLNFIIITEYLLFIWFIILILSTVIPSLLSELYSLPKNIPFLQDEIELVIVLLEEIKNDYSVIWWTLTNFIDSKDFSVVKNIYVTIKNAWFLFMQFLLSLILSFIFIIDRKKLHKYLLKLKKSNFRFMYNDYKSILKKVVKSFWLILEAQALIALVNTTLTIIWLYIIASIFFYLWISQTLFFPYILTIWLFVFILWFIPILWTILSSIPILIIWYNFVWWIPAVLAILWLIAFIHSIEAYYLNPKIVSNYIELPMSLTFIILIISEHFFWLWWLLIWVSLFYFIALLLKDFNNLLSKAKKDMWK